MSEWFSAKLIKSYMLAEGIKCLVFHSSNAKRHVAGQFYTIRKTNEKNYLIDRIYSLANSPNNEGIIEIGVQYIENGEISPFLFNLKDSEEVLVKGPQGVYFNLEKIPEKPIIFVAGGVGIVPIMSMIRFLLNKKTKGIYLLGSFRSIKNIPYLEELKNNKKLSLILTLTREQPNDWNGLSRRIDREIIQNTFNPQLLKESLVYVCGSTRFAEEVSLMFKDLGVNDSRINTERFG